MSSTKIKFSRNLITAGLAEVRTPRSLRIASSMLREGAADADARGDHEWAGRLREAYALAQSDARTNPQVAKALAAIRALLAAPTRDEIVARYGHKGHTLVWCNGSFECTACGASGSLATVGASEAPACLQGRA